MPFGLAAKDKVVHAPERLMRDGEATFGDPEESLQLLCDHNCFFASFYQIWQRAEQQGVARCAPKPFFFLIHLSFFLLHALHSTQTPAAAYPEAPGWVADGEEADGVRKPML
jgi:hypothetical protein